MVYRIIDWDDYFENYKSRTINDCSWVPMPNKHDGDCYTRLVEDHEHGEAHFGIWCALVQICSRQKLPRQGWLTKGGTENGKPYDTQALARKTRMREPLIDEALERLVSVGWIGTFPSEGVPQEYHKDTTESRGTLEQKGTEQKGTEQKEEAATSVPATFIELARTFLRKQKERFPKESALQDFETRVTDGAGKLYLFHTQDNWTEDEIRDLLDWVLKDEFWCRQIRTLGGIRSRKKGADTPMKFENAKAGMEQRKPTEEHDEQKYREAIDKETLRQRRESERARAEAATPEEAREALRSDPKARRMLESDADS